MAVHVVRHVAGGEHARHAGGGGIAVGAAGDLDVAVVHGQLALEQAGVRRVADGDEDAGNIQLPRLPVRRAGQTRAGDARGVAKHFCQGVVPHHLHGAPIGAFEQPVLQHLLRPQGVAPMHDVDAAGDVGEVERFFHGGVAAADHGDRLVAEEEAVAGRAGAHAAPFVRFLGRQAEVLGGSAGRHDQGVAGVDGLVAFEAQRAAAQVHAGDVVVDELGAVLLHMGLHPLHEIRALQAVVIARPVVHIRGGRELAAHFDAGDQRRLEIGPRCVERRRAAGRPGTEHDQAAVDFSGHRAA